VCGVLAGSFKHHRLQHLVHLLGDFPVHHLRRVRLVAVV
jgi:hypothetical protein